MIDHEQRLADYDEQVRAKYDADELQALGEKGHAFKNNDGRYSYPIDDVDDLKNAIKAVGRGNADHDAIRKYIIGRAKDLGQSDLIPENWNSDGSLGDEEKAAAWDAQHRDAGMTYGDICDALSSAVQAEYGSDEDWTYVADFTDSWVVYCCNGEKFQVGYSFDGTTVTFDGQPEPVRHVTSYVPLEAKSTAKPAANRSPIILKRAFGNLTERAVPVSRIEIRMDGESDDPNIAHFTGYASTTGQAYSVTDWLGEYRETIQPGAFAKTLREQGDVPLLFNHDGYPLASTGSGTSLLAEDAHGLRNDAALDRSDGNTNTVCVQLKRGVLNKMSFAFRAIKDSWNDAYDERNVSELALYDTSIVTYPANPGTEAALRAEMRQAFRAALGREGMGLMLSVRTAMALDHRIAETAEPSFDNAIRALVSADEFMCHRYGLIGRARTFQVAGMFMQARQGKVLSTENLALANKALAAAHAADDNDIVDIVQRLQSIDAALDITQEALATLIGKSDPDGDKDDLEPALKAPSKNGDSGLDSDQGGGSGSGKNPLQPQDGAGPRSAVLSVEHTRRLVAKLREKQL